MRKLLPSTKWTAHGTTGSAVAVDNVELLELLQSVPGIEEEPMTDLSAIADDTLLRRMLAGDEETFTALYRRRQGGIYRFSLRMSGSQTIAEDVTQDVFLLLIREALAYDASRG